MDVLQNNFYIVVGLLVVGIVVIYRLLTNEILTIDAQGALSSFGRTINVSSTKEVKFKFKSTDFTGVTSINISTSQDMSTGAFCILEKGFPNYTVTLQNSNPKAILNTFNGSIFADTIFYVQFPSAVTSFYLYTNNND